MIKIIMHGCNGHMGQVISEIVSKDSNCEIVAGIDPYDGIHNPYPVFKEPSLCTVDADVIIDFSNSSAIKPLLDFAISKTIPIVVCTTGFDDEAVSLINAASNHIPVLYSRNMSLGVNLLISLVQKAASVLVDANFDIEIIEKHHNKKIDAPSGTALAFADAINDTFSDKFDYKYDRSEERNKRPKKEIGIHALRGGTIVGEHSIIFAGLDETIELKHSANSKEIFAVGATNAAKFLAHQPTGMYDMSDVIKGY